MDDDDILQMHSFRKSGIRTSQIFGSFAGQAGGFQNLTFSVQNMYNEVDKERRSKGTDSRAALSYLRSLKNGDPTLFWKHTVDKEGRLEHLFWCDGRSQIDYKLFGDVLAFDATYKKKSIEGTYVWLLETFLEAMQGKMPNSVITDGDLAMRNAIRRVFPKAHHRLCAWHLARNANCNVKNSRFTTLFKKCMLFDYEIVDFERKWNEMVQECGVEDNAWVLDMYEKKDMWATAHIRGKFFGGFRTTSRCEGLHAKIAYAETLELLNGHYARVKHKYGLQPDEGIVLEDRNDRFLQNPLNANTKGRGGRGSTKHQTKRKRQRGHCGLCGIVGHNKQTCIGLTNRKKQLDKNGSTDNDSENGDDDDDDDDDYRGPNH
ncbi:hypothetical protein TSUD_294620 [Trifolium subterraneum]|uniref:MULE transposase domain-containing protein n=1 Tax=Trifolium subterraneum TaxID=3900 RepID=A0A2Z6MA28_TRISU|nr:hypothetical protein TSUD_294620 [Trifolium subterraneum]